ncbi:polysaccharide deacetylase family protein [Candidatus Parcubacteria bacterium]|nr:polysaccharide deacetylase family protein [Candidatus Parcubacteria bacterium]
MKISRVGIATTMVFLAGAAFFGYRSGRSSREFVSAVSTFVTTKTESIVTLLPGSDRGNSPLEKLLKVLGLMTQEVRVPILLYHYVEPYTDDENDFMRRWMTVLPGVFDEQLRLLEEHGYTTITLGDLAEALTRRRRLPEKAVVLTFDDGYRDFYTHAFPILKKHNAKATNFIIYNHLGLRNNLTKAQVREMLDSGLVEIGAHTLNHAYLPYVSEEQAWREISECKSTLEEEFGVDIYSLAYPGGKFDEAALDLVREAGYQVAVSTIETIYHTESMLFKLGRVKVGNWVGEEFLNLLQ